jgi:hypothetical protein
VTAAVAQRLGLDHGHAYPGAASLKKNPLASKGSTRSPALACRADVLIMF